ncbi:MAG: MqnA/MqnD/SBP family protein [Nitrososphaeraceae archaeon]
MIDITLGHTPDADDAFMFYGLANGKVNSNEFKIDHIIEDIESLNTRALNNELDITAISAHAYAYLHDYTILNSGGSFGINYGPILVAKKKIEVSHLNNKIIAIPGKMTSAYLLLLLLLNNFKKEFISFDRIPNLVLDEKVDAGLIIHEAQITYNSFKLLKIFDLGKWWHTKTNGLPVPLGINIANNKTMTNKQIKKFDLLFRESINYSLNHPEDAIDYAMQYGRGEKRDLISKFVKMYVNDITIDMGTKGKMAIELMLKMATNKKLIPKCNIIFN